MLVQFTETNRHLRPVEIDIRRSLNNIARAYALTELRTIFLTMFFFNAGFGFFVSFFGVFLIYRFGFDEGQIGHFSYVGLWMIFTQLVTTRFVAARVAEARVLRATLFGVSIAMAAYTVVPTSVDLLIGPLSATFNGLSMANMGGLLSRSVPPEVQGEILGIGSSIQALAQALPPLGAGFVAASFAPTAPVMAASFTMLLAWATFAALYRPGAVAVAVPR